jgi:hypothetical protein
MENLDFIEQLTALTSQEDVLSVSQSVNELKTKFNDYVLEEERKQQVAQMEAEEKGETVPEPEGDFGKEAFYAIYDEYKAKRKAIIEEQKAVETKNLQEKKGLINKLREVVQTEENIGAAFASFKEIQEKWKSIGDIPRVKRNEIQTEYSKLLEDFFYNIKIYKELKDHDFHRNHQLKIDLIEKLKSLVSIDNIKEVETHLKSLQNDWEDIGPVPNEKWEEVKDAYWTEVRSIYERINRFYDDRRSEQQDNLKKKEELLEETKGLTAQIGELSGVKAWDDATSAILDIQKRWKTVGFGPKKENEEIWKAFRAECDTFFNAKKEFFNVVNSKFDKIAEKKKALIDKASELKSSTNWKETSNQLIQLQKQWKQLGHAGRKNEQKLWKAFRGACDEFFNARQEHFSAQDKANEDNLKEKEALIAEIEKFKLPTDKSEALASLKEFAQRFNSIGHVPMKSKDGVYKSYKAALDKHYGSLKMEGAEKERVLFQAKLDTIQSSPNASRMFRSLKQDLRKEIDRQQKEITLLENNLGFFANSKGADALKQDVDKKIQKAQAKINEIKGKLKLVPNE